MSSKILPLSDSCVSISDADVKWQPLSSPDSFRLLTIKPGTESSIHCSLEEYSLSDPPSYDAISYCWTTSQGSNTVICNGSPVPVSQSLYNALTAMRRLGQGRVWIDGLCISQGDIEERSQQVQNIGRIFRGATAVCIHLGEESEQTYGALEVIERSVNSLGFNHKSHDFGTILRLLQQPWFERLWVIQEICNARQVLVMHGSCVVPWSYIVSLCRDLDALYAKSPIKVAENITKVCLLDQIRSDFHDLDKGHFLLDLVMSTSKFKVSDPRDKVFALVGLAKDVTDADWEVRLDYASTVGDVYHRFALWNLAKRDDLRILSYCQEHSMSSDYSLPSWVPDFSQSDKFRRPRILALSDEPPNPGKLVKSTARDTGLLFGSTDEVNYAETNYTFQTPDKQWGCADGIARSLRPGLKSWYMDSLDTANPLRRRVSFSGNNQIVHFVGVELDELDTLSDPAFSESTESGHLFSMLQSRTQRWDPGDVWQLLRFIQKSSLHDLEWIAQCASIVDGVCKKAVGDITIQAPTIKDLIMTLCCRRLLSGLPDPSVTDSQLMSLLGIRSTNMELTATRDHFDTFYSPKFHTLETLDLQPKQCFLYHTLCNDDTGKSRRLHHRKILIDSLSPEAPAGWQQVYPVIAQWSRARRFGSTKGGRLANVPTGAQVGDKICVFLGGSVPYILRRREDGYYDLVGECYVHGTMQGEIKMSGQRRSGVDGRLQHATKQFAIK